MTTTYITRPETPMQRVIINCNNATLVQALECGIDRFNECAREARSIGQERLALQFERQAAETARMIAQVENQ